MIESLPVVHLARPGETAWSLSGQHTGLTDLSLTDHGERNARRLADRLKGLSFRKVFTSPSDRDLLEWNYGEYEGRRVEEIHAERPDWQLFRDGWPGGESPQQVGARADRVVKRTREIHGNVLIFSSRHIERVLTAGWLKLGPADGKYVLLSTASLSALGCEHNLSQPVIQLWNDTNHVGS